MGGWAITPRSTNGLLVGVDESHCIVMRRINVDGALSWEHTITNVDQFVQSIIDARTERTILDDLHSAPGPTT
jgi:hypothetical protein